MPQSMQEMLNRSLMELPSQQYTPSNTAASEFAPLSALSAMGAGPYADPAGVRAQKAQELSQYGGDSTALQQLIAPAFEPAPEVATRIPMPQAPVAPQAIEASGKVQKQPDLVPEVQKFEKQAQEAAVEGYKEGSRQQGAIQGMMDQKQAAFERMQQVQAEREKVRREQMVESQKANEELMKYEPKDFWADKSTGSKIAAGLAMALGAYASAMTGGPNTAMQIIDNAINRDLALQKERYNRAKERGAMIKSAYADQLAILGDKEAAELGMLNYAYKNIDQKLSIMQQQTQNELTRANIAKTRQEMQLAIDANEQKKIEKLVQMKMAQGLTKGEQINPELLPKEQRERFVQDPEYGGLARNEQGANKVSEALIEYRNAKDLLGTLQQIAKTPGKSLSPQLRAQAETAAAALKGKLRGPIVGPGAVSETEWKLLDGIVKNPTDFFSLDARTQARLTSLNNLLDSNMGNTAKAYGIQPKVTPTESNSIYVRLDGKAGMIPKANFDRWKQAQEKLGKKVEVISGK